MAEAAQQPLQLQTLILAGGQSRRMGQDKALLTLPGQPTSLLGNTVAIASSISEQVWISTPWREAYQFLLSAQVYWLDDPLQQGGLVALSEFLHTQPDCDWVLLLACDLPYLRQSQLTQWCLELAQCGDRQAIALVKNKQGLYEPMCGFYRVTVAASLARFRATGDRSFQRWLATEAVYPLSLRDPKMLFNCNTPVDFATLKGKFP